MHFSANYNMQIYYLQYMQIITHAKYNNKGINCNSESFYLQYIQIITHAEYNDKGINCNIECFFWARFNTKFLSSQSSQPPQGGAGGGGSGEVGNFSQVLPCCSFEGFPNTV